MHSLIVIQMKSRTIWLTLLLASVVLPFGSEPLFADIDSRPLSVGGNLASKGDITNIEMTDEVVKLRIMRDACHVDVVFTMTNTGKIDVARCSLLLKQD